MPSNTLARYFGASAGSSALSIKRPDGLSDALWAPIKECVDRLNRAIADDDLHLCIGVAKELTEATAKVVWEARGHTVPNAPKYSYVVTNAQTFLDRQPGRGLATIPPVRDIAQGALTIASKLDELRNSYGTGHGRAYIPDVPEDLALVSIDGAVLWTRWALRRLEAMILGLPTALANDLLSGATFYGGKLTERLLAARLPDLDLANQHLIGLAVARRAMRDTFLVKEEGVERCAETHDLAIWPTGYREALLEGLFLAIDGSLYLTPWSVGQATLLVGSLPVDSDVVSKLADKCYEANYAQRLFDDVNHEAALAALRSATSSIPDWARSSWERIISRVEIPF